MRTINWNKYQSDPKTYAKNRYLNRSVGPRFQGVNRFLVLSFENVDDRRSHSGYHLPDVEVMIDGKNAFDQAMNNDFRRYENIQKTTAGQEDDYTAGCLLD